MTILDISVPLSEATPCWPGEAPFRAVTEDKGTCTVSALWLGSHSGTHLDAARHFFADGRGVHDVPLTELVGEAVVCHFPGTRTIGVPELRARDFAGAERVLLRTDNSLLWGKGDFFEGYASVDLEAAEYLAELGVRLVGIDYLSIERFESPGNPVHKLLLSKGVSILEGLDLSRVPEGRYTLVALPLPVQGLDGAPVRAVLLRS
ncbi:MAG: cyclase family protein [Deltaproteobacteria bacterium]|nr:cyclase family protein [Deltaproteobacteria bacterium]